MTISPIILITTLLFVSGCSILGYNPDRQNTTSSSLVDFLYPEGTTRVSHEYDIPFIKLPVNVGIAFVPSNNWRTKLDEKTQMSLLMDVKNRFAEHKYVNRIELIPSTYLKQRNGFSTLNQVARMHDVDVMALVSYDQLVRNYEKEASLLYWTIVGMYLVQGNENTTQTFVDMAVFDVRSQKLLFRAPGASKSRDRTTAIELQQVSDQNALSGFENAFANMTNNLEIELEQFTERVREEKIIKVERKQGYSGGSLHWYLLCGLFLLCISKRYSLNQFQEVAQVSAYNLGKSHYRSYQHDLANQQRSTKLYRPNNPGRD